MKRIAQRTLRIIIGCILLSVVPYVMVYFFINERGKDILLDTLKSRYNIEASVTSLIFSFPLRFTLVDARYKNIRCAQAVADLGIANPFSKHFKIHKLYLKGLRVKLDKETIAFFAPFEAAGIGTSRSPAAVPSAAGQKTSLKIDKVVLDDVYFLYTQKDLTPPLKLSFENVSGRIGHIRYPELSKIFIDIKGSIRVNRRSAKDVLRIAGWFDWPRKNMNMSVQLNSLDYFVFTDYYPPFWKPKNLELKDFYLSLDSQLISENDDLFMDYYIIVDKIDFVNEPENEANVKSYKTILEVLKRGGTKPVAHFSNKTKMSRPTFNITSIGEGLLAQLQSLQTNEARDSINRFLDKTQEAARDGVDDFKAITIDPFVQGLQAGIGALLKNIKKIMKVDQEEQEEPAKEDIVEENSEEDLLLDELDVPEEEAPDDASAPAVIDSPVVDKALHDEL